MNEEPLSTIMIMYQHTAVTAVNKTQTMCPCVKTMTLVTQTKTRSRHASKIHVSSDTVHHILEVRVLTELNMKLHPGQSSVYSTLIVL